MPENRFRSQLPAALLLSALLAATIALIEPAKSAIGNWSEIGIGISTLLARLATPFAAAFVGIAAFAVLLTAVAPRRAVPILAALYVALWAQGSLLVWEYGIFDGSPIDWSEHSGKALLELAFWAAVLALALIKHEWIRRRWLPIAAIVFALQFAAIAELALRNPPMPESSDSEASIVGPQEVRSVSLYSRELNVIIIVLDALQSDFFSESMRDPGLRAAMPPGFTYYRNATSLYVKTVHSVHSMLTSRTIPGPNWRGVMAESLPNRLAEQGFDAVVTTFGPTFRASGDWGYRYVTGAALAGAGAASAAWREDVSDMFALGTFRLSPHFLKRRIYYDGQWRTPRLYPQLNTVSRNPKVHQRTRMDLAVFEELIASASAGNTAPQFRFLHFFGPHRPWTVDQNCDYPPTATGRRRTIDTTHCILSRVYEYLDKLDEIGVYDQSLIFVVGDHGQPERPLEMSAAAPAIPANGETDDALRGRDTGSRPWHGMAVPIFLAKPLGDRDALRISDEPVSLCDLPRSVFESLAMEHDFGCESVFSVQNPRQTPRIVHFHNITEEKKRAWIGLPPREAGEEYEKFTVIGHSWLRESWVPNAVFTE
jgi:hypothetical protein